jgi:predicted phage-related endonuclease
MSMLELWMIKTGRMQQNIEDESRLCTFVLGQAARTFGAEYYSMHTNNKVRRVNAVLQHPDEDKHLCWRTWIMPWWVMKKFKS